MDIRTQRFTDNSAYGNLAAFHRRHKDSESTTDTGVHFLGCLGRCPVDGLKFFDKFIELLNIASQLETSQRSAQVEDLLRKSQTLRSRHGGHCFCDLSHDFRHCPEISVCIGGSDPHRLEFRLDLGVGELAVRLTQRCTGQAAFNAHIRQNSQRSRHIGDRVTGSSSLGTGHFQTFCKVSQGLS